MSCISNYFIVLSKTPLDYHLLSYNESPFHHFCGKNLSWASNPFLCLFGVGDRGESRYYKIKGGIIYLQFVVTLLLSCWFKLITTE